MIKLHMIAAVGKNGALGLDNKLPWHAPDDLRLFKQLTTNHHIIVGKRTAATLPVLPSRFLEVWDGKQAPENFLLDLVQQEVKCAWLCGGAHTYRVFAPYINGNRVINFIDYDGPSDTTFPFDAYDLKWQI